MVMACAPSPRSCDRRTSATERAPLRGGADIRLEYLEILLGYGDLLEVVRWPQDNGVRADAMTHYRNEARSTLLAKCGLPALKQEHLVEGP